MQVGTRVRIVKDVENYPTIYLEAGETGTLVQIDDTPYESFYWVRLDRHHDELDEWDNQLQIYYDRATPPEYHPSRYLEVVAP